MKINYGVDLGKETSTNTAIQQELFPKQCLSLPHGFAKKEHNLIQLLAVCVRRDVPSSIQYKPLEQASFKPFTMLRDFITRRERQRRDD